MGCEEARVCHPLRGRMMCIRTQALQGGASQEPSLGEAHGLQLMEERSAPPGTASLSR
jgi:hypothetical protein